MWRGGEAIGPADQRGEVETPARVQSVDGGVVVIVFEVSAQVVSGVPDSLTGRVVFDPSAETGFRGGPVGGIFDFAGEEPGFGGDGEEGVDGRVNCH